MAIRDLSGWPEEYKRRWRERHGFDRPAPRPEMARLSLAPGGRPERAWINQPSLHQPHHALHGREVLAVREPCGWVCVYFKEGACISQFIAEEALSAGWPSEGK